MKVKATWYEVLANESVEESRLASLDPEKIAKALDSKGRFDPVNTKSLNAKSIGSRRKISDEKNIIATYLQALKPGADRKAYSKAKTAWARYKTKMNNDFQDLVRQLEKGSITKTQFLNSSRKLFKAGYEQAYRLGTDASGLDFVKLPKEDLAWLKRARTADYKFLDKFADDVVNKRGKMSYNARASMYIDTIDGMFDAGRVDAYPNEGTSIFWELSAAENCGDCIDLALNSPYTPDTLPTTPRAGGTMCLSACKCSLRVRYDRPTDIPIQVSSVPADVAKKLGVNTVGGEIEHVEKAYSKGGGRTGLEATGLDSDGDVVGIDSEAVLLDWDALDDMVTALATIRILESEEPSVHRVHETQTALNKFMEASKKLPEWLDPFSRDVYVCHAIGTVVLDYAKNARREGVKAEDAQD
jgi:hypothetical protein